MPHAIRTKKFNSDFLQAVADTFTALNDSAAYAQFTKFFELLKHFTIGMKSAMKMRPTEADYDLVEYHLPMYALRKAMLWPGSLAWYDNHNLYHLPHMMRKWGSLGLVSQEGMEGWQKVLNQILRMGNGFANAGAIPIAVKEQGPQAVLEYLLKRKEGKSQAKWVYDQALLKDYSTLSSSLDAYHELAPLIRTWNYFTARWLRYEQGTLLTVRWVGWWRLRKAREKGSTYYKELLDMYKAYWEGTTAEDREKPLFERHRLRTQRHARWADAKRGAMYPRINAPLEQQIVPGILLQRQAQAYHAVHPCQRTAEDWLEGGGEREEWGEGEEGEEEEEDEEEEW